MNGIDTENIYINIRSTIERMKGKIISKNLFLNKMKTNSKKKKEQIDYLKATNLFPSNNKNWTFTKFSTYKNNFLTECPYNSSDEKENFIKSELDQSSHIDITNTIYDLNQCINYSKLNNFIKAEIELEGESKFWIFLHCDEKNYNNKTAVFILSRDISYRSFISLGTFIEKSEITNLNNNQNLKAENKFEFIEFKKQELIEENTIKEKEEKYIKLLKEQNNDKNIRDIYERKSFYEINIIDDGYKIIFKVKLNNGEYINEIIGDFFSPVFENVNEINNDENENELDNIINLNIKDKDTSNSYPGYKIRIAGSGEKCTVVYFENELNLKNQKFEFNRDNDCQCCEIF